MIAKMAGYAFRLRSSSYGGQVGSNPPELRAALQKSVAIRGKPIWPNLLSARPAANDPNRPLAQIILAPL
jgi:hypothetical protein